MTPGQVNEGFETGRIQLSTEEIFNYYFFLLSIPFLLHVFSVSKKMAPTEPVSPTEIVFLFLGISAICYFAYLKYEALAFKKYKLQHTPQDFKAAAEITALELNWTIIKLTDTILIANKAGSIQEHDRIRITIIRRNNRIYSNSIVMPFWRSNFFSYGWNVKNLQVFNNNLFYATKGEDFIEKAKAIEKEKKIQLEKDANWDLLHSAKRIVIYFFTFILAIILTLSILFGISMLF